MRSYRLALMLMLALPAPCAASVARICNVSYETGDGWSAAVAVEVTFVTGRELNKATRSFSYGVLDNYALIWFSRDEVAILQLDDMLLGVGEEFDNDDFRRLYQLQDTAEFHQVNTQSQRPWRIVGKEFLSFIDPRAER
jgi:hypothetical protein